MNFAKNYIDQLNHADFHTRVGRVTQYVGMVIEASGPLVDVGDICLVHPTNNERPIKAEVVGFRDGRVLLMPFGRVRGVSLGSKVVATGRTAHIKVSNDMLGRVVDAFGEPIDGLNDINDSKVRDIYENTINPLDRKSLHERLNTGISVIDSFVPLAKGQRLGIFSGSGVGKSSLLGMFAKNVESDINVIALIGERGREVKDFIHDVIGEDGLKNTIIVVATADEPALVRAHAVYSALTIAEHFSDQGKDVLLTLDSITRFAMAQREVGLAIGEPPTTKGYTPSVFSSLSPIVERAGSFEDKGSITALFTVLVESDDVNDPISDYMRGILDGHIILSRELANRGTYPAVDILNSKSRLQNKIVEPQTQQIVLKALQAYSQYFESKEMINIGAYESGSNPNLDQSITQSEAIIEFITQKIDDHRVYEQTIKRLKEIVE